MPIPAQALPHRPSFRSWLGLTVLMLPVLLVTVDNTIVGFALPRIAEALRPSASQQLWMIDAYSLVLAGLLVSMGSLGDRLGHRKLLLIGALGFTVVSVLTACSQTAAQLIAGRAVMGVFGAMLMPSTLALIRSLFEEREQRRLAVAIWATTLTVGSALGPLIGGVLLSFFHWQAIFLLAVPVLVPLLVLGPCLLPESNPEPAGRLDSSSILQSMLALGGLVFAIKHVASEGPDGLAGGVLCIALLAGGAFVRRQGRLATPLMDLGLLRNGAFAGSVMVNLLSLAFLIGFMFCVTQLLQIVLQLSVLQASLALVPGQLLAIIVGMLVVPIAQRVQAHRLVPSLLGFIALAFLLVAGLGSSLVTLIVAFALLNVGVGAIATVSNDLVLAAAPPSKAGAASAISETAYEIGVVLGTTVLGGVVTAYYRSALQVPDTLTVIQGQLVRETLAGAQVVAGELPIEQAGELMRLANRAFENGVQGMAWGAIVLAVMAMALSWRSLGKRQESTQSIA